MNPPEFFSQAAGYLARQNVMLSIKECLGWLAMAGILSMLLVLCYRYRKVPRQLLPRMIDVARLLRLHR